MYAKLVTSSNTSPSILARDVIRLCTSNSPSTADLGGFSNTSSSIIDATPAGWTYEWSTVDSGTLATVAAAPSVTPTSAADWWGMSAPCLGPLVANGTLKYVKLTTGASTNRANSDASNTVYGFSLSGATNIASGNTVTNEGWRRQANGSVAAAGSSLSLTQVAGIGTFHLIATPRHITIIKEGAMFTGLWETAITDVHTFYSSTAAPFVQVNLDNTSTSISMGSSVDSVYSASTQSIYFSSTASNGWNFNLFGITVPSTGTYYGTLSMGSPDDWSQATATTNLSIQPYLFPLGKLGSINSSGVTRNLITPIFINGQAIGYPTIDISSICNIYATRAGIATTGDTVDINGTTYTYFNSGTLVSPRGVGLLLLTS